MATKAKAAKGTKLKRGDGGGTELFTDVGEVTSVTPPGITVPTADATSHDSTFEEVVATIPSGGEVSVEMLFVGSNAQQQALRTDCKNGTLRNFRVVLPDHATTPTTFAFSAIVTSIAPSAATPADAQKQSVTLKISGEPTVVQYAPT